MIKCAFQYCGKCVVSNGENVDIHIAYMLKCATSNLLLPECATSNFVNAVRIGADIIEEGRHSR